MAPHQILSGALVLALITGMAIGAALRSARRVSWPRRRDLLRSAWKLRSALRVAPLAEFLYLSATALVLLTALLAWLMPAGMEGALVKVGWGVVVPLALGAAVVADWVYRVASMARYPVFRRLLAIALAAAAATALFLAGAYARRALVSATGLDPRVFPDTLQMAATVLYPVACVGILCVLLAVLSLVEALVLVLTAIGATVSNFGSWGKRVTHIAARLVFGMRSHDPWYARFFVGAHLALRPIALLVLISMFSSLATINGSGWLGQGIRWSVLFFDSTPNSGRCRNLAADSPVVLAEPHAAIAFQASGLDLKLRRERCDS